MTSPGHHVALIVPDHGTISKAPMTLVEALEWKAARCDTLGRYPSIADAIRALGWTPDSSCRRRQRIGECVFCLGYHVRPVFQALSNARLDRDAQFTLRLHSDRSSATAKKQRAYHAADADDADVEAIPGAIAADTRANLTTIFDQVVPEPPPTPLLLAAQRLARRNKPERMNP
jgi:hypothetical protein